MQLTFSNYSTEFKNCFISECKGVTREVRNGVTKFYLMKGELTTSEEDDTSWVSGACAEDHSGLSIFHAVITQLIVYSFKHF